MECIYKSKLNDAHFCSIACRYCTYEQEASCKHKKTDNAFDIEKKILNAQTPEEIDAITATCDMNMLRNVIKLLVDHFTPVNVKMNHIMLTL